MPLVVSTLWLQQQLRLLTDLEVTDLCTFDALHPRSIAFFLLLDDEYWARAGRRSTRRQRQRDDAALMVE